MSFLAPQKHKLLLELLLLLLLQRVSSLADGGLILMKKLSMLCQSALFHRTYIDAPERPGPNRLLVCMVTLILFVISNEACQLIFYPKKLLNSRLSGLWEMLLVIPQDAVILFLAMGD